MATCCCLLLGGAVTAPGIIRMKRDKSTSAAACVARSLIGLRPAIQGGKPEGSRLLGKPGGGVGVQVVTMARAAITARVGTGSFAGRNLHPNHSRDFACTRFLASR